MNKIEHKLALMRQRVINEATQRKIMTLEEMPIYVGKYFDEYGIDSFINYLSMLTSDVKMEAFITLCKPMIKDRKKIEKRFGVKIITPKELILNNYKEVN